MIFPLNHDADALIDMEEGRRVSYREIACLQEDLPVARTLVFLFTQNRWQEVAAYVALMNQGHLLCLLDARLDEGLKEKLLTTYRPEYVVSGSAGNYGMPQPSPLPGLNIWRRAAAPPLHPELALLLSTSGTTGSPKMVRLSKQNILSNASSIISYLGIDAKEKALASLPIHYSYGLSVLHTHLLAGATTLLTRKSVVQQEFWQEAAAFGGTSFAGVPYTYSLLDRIGFETFDLPALKTMTQAGGALSKELALKFHRLMQERGGRFFVMYGQTEATARIAYLAPADLPAKVGAIGKAIPGGTLKIVEGELIYEGPNVMLGYANRPEDLALGDQLGGVLHTGDLASCDAEGFFTVTGRQKRISKVYGARINLDEIEGLLRPLATVAATSDDQQIFLYFEEASEALIEQGVKLVADKTHLHYSTFKALSVAKLPRTPSGKIDYGTL